MHLFINMKQNYCKQYYVVGCASILFSFTVKPSLLILNTLIYVELLFLTQFVLTTVLDR